MRNGDIFTSQFVVQSDTCTCTDLRLFETFDLDTKSVENIRNKRSQNSTKVNKLVNSEWLPQRFRFQCILM